MKVDRLLYIRCKIDTKKPFHIFFQFHINQSLISNEQNLLISFRKKRKMFGKEWIGNSKECLIFARSYEVDKMKTSFKNRIQLTKLLTLNHYL